MTIYYCQEKEQTMTTIFSCKKKNKKRKQHTIEKNNETGSWFLKKINEIDKTLTRLTKKTQIIKSGKKEETLPQTLQILNT